MARQVGSKGTLLPNAPGSAFASRKGAYILVDGTKYRWSGSAWIDESGIEARRVGEPSVTPPSTLSGRQAVVPHGPPSQVKLASSKIVLIQSLLKICEGNKEFSMTGSDESDLMLEEKVEAPKFLGLTVGSPKKGYRARIWLDEGKKEVKYQEIEDRSRSVGVIPAGKGGFGLKPEALGKVQENPMADRMRGSIRQVVESAGWRLSYAT
jgi:hypothetical protein